MDIPEYCSWASSCGRKVRCKNAARARKKITSSLHWENGLDVESLQAYRCRFCGGFHVGHQKCDKLFQSTGKDSR